MPCSTAGKKKRVLRFSLQRYMIFWQGRDSLSAEPKSSGPQSTRKDKERAFVKFDTEDSIWQRRNLTTMVPVSRSMRWRPWRESCSRRYKNSSRARKGRGSSGSGRNGKSRNDSKRRSVRIGRPAAAPHRIFSIEMINPNPFPTWRTAFGLS